MDSRLNSGTPRRAPVPVRKGDGSPYLWELISEDGERRYYADTLAELATALIPPAAGETVTEEERLRHARAVMMQVRQALLAEFIAAGNSLSDEESAHYAEQSPAIDFWDSALPLVLIRSDYSPATDIPVPLGAMGDLADDGNIIWIRPETDDSYLRSLHSVGWIRLNRASLLTP